MVHACLLFYIGFMVTVSACKNIEWLHKKVLFIKAWISEKKAQDPVIKRLRLVASS